MSRNQLVALLTAIVFPTCIQLQEAKDPKGFEAALDIAHELALVILNKCNRSPEAFNQGS